MERQATIQKILALNLQQNATTALAKNAMKKVDYTTMPVQSKASGVQGIIYRGCAGGVLWIRWRVKRQVLVATVIV
jgi:hypothetical protein